MDVTLTAPTHIRDVVFNSHPHIRDVGSSVFFSFRKFTHAYRLKLTAASLNLSIIFIILENKMNSKECFANIFLHFLQNQNHHLKVVGNEKLGGSRGWLMVEGDTGLWWSMSVCFLM